jgi:hypothetical protein
MPLNISLHISFLKVLLYNISNTLREHLRESMLKSIFKTKNKKSIFIHGGVLPLKHRQLHCLLG